MTRKTNITTVLFDLDGTILDTNELIIQSFLYALDGLMPEGFGRNDIIPSMGMPLVYQLGLFSGREQNQVEDLVKKYREYNLREHDRFVTAFPQVNMVLKRLKEEGCQLGVVTTKMRLTTEMGLKLTGIYDYMDTLVTIDDVQHAKPHPEPIQLALKQLKADPAQTLMIGDSVVDMQSAVAAGVCPVGVAWSLKGEEKLREAGAEHMLHQMADLFALVGLERSPVEKG